MASWRKQALAVCVALAALGAGLGTADGQDPASPALPQAFCQTPPAQSEGEPATGFYRVRPRGCRFHRLGLEQKGLSDLTFRIRWRRWTGSSANGVGRHAVHVFNFKTGKHYKSSAAEAVRLSRPREICGHEVFTRLKRRVYSGDMVIATLHSDLDELDDAEEGCPR